MSLGLQQRCLITSAGVHGMVLAALLISSLVVSRRSPTVNLPVLTLIPDRVVDAALFGGGRGQSLPRPAVDTPPARPQAQPVATPPPVVQSPPRQTREPARPQPTPQPVESRVESRPQRTASRTVTPESTRPRVRVNTEISQRDASTANTSSSVRERSRPRENTAERVRQERSSQRALANRVDSQVRDALSNLSSSLSSGTSIEMPGPGGEAYANYTQVVKSLYDHAWLLPESVQTSSAYVVVDIVVDRSGRIVSEKIVERSGVTAVNASVSEALARVRARGLPEFPRDSTDTRRTFRIRFDVQDKRISG